MEQLVAHLTRDVLPKVPLRLWTVSFPFDLRSLLAADPTFLSFVHATFVRQAIGLLERRGRIAGLSSCRSGAVSMIQLFDSGLRASPHFHCLLPDGVWAPSDHRGLRFHEIVPGPSDIEAIACSMAAAIRRVLRRRGRLGADGEVLPDDNNQDPSTLERLFEQAARERIARGHLTAEDRAVSSVPSPHRALLLQSAGGSAPLGGT